MCTYSNAGDQYSDPTQWPWHPSPPIYPTNLPPNVFPDFATITRDAVVADLKTRVEALEKLLAAAKKFDDETGHPDCELEPKKQLLRDLAKQFGVEINLP